jgi:hypothetical protein
MISIPVNKWKQTDFQKYLSAAIPRVISAQLMTEQAFAVSLPADYGGIMRECCQYSWDTGEAMREIL